MSLGLACSLDAPMLCKAPRKCLYVCKNKRLIRRTFIKKRHLHIRNKETANRQAGSQANIQYVITMRMQCKWSGKNSESLTTIKTRYIEQYYDVRRIPVHSVRCMVYKIYATVPLSNRFRKQWIKKREKKNILY